MSSPAATVAALATAYWCYSCSRTVRVWPGDVIACPACRGGFLEEIDNPPPIADGAIRRRRRTTSSGDEPFPAANTVDLRTRRGRRASVGDRSPFNPVIVLPGSAADGGAASVVQRSNDASSFELYYDDGGGSGLRPLPQSMSDFLMGSGFDRLLDQLTQIESGVAGGGRSYENTPASKAAIESLPTITITSAHIAMDSHCAVCTEAFDLGAEAREMPCKHIFHEDCILPWLSLRNSCPVCRHELPTDVRRRGGDSGVQALISGEEDAVGLSIWRLPGGGYAVGRFSGSRQTGERELPVVYTEMDGSFNSSGAPRRIPWSSERSRSRESRGIGRMFRRFFSSFGCFGPSSSSSASSTRRRVSSSASQASQRGLRTPTLSRSLGRNDWAYEDGSRND
ncbi:E3 ubiquitin-protein ligase RING1 [Apostasia shenzhenica]|uniref:RING-type E3 ubiquitin transferase n=1 Tax=Apostasia shenzhenica TaxID=1088818 RepID=A0A2I0A8U8_9ASPA|nr:E3 ubiquitin-protein ligase RING1 [Apostasia shenzhenica]